MKTYYKTTIDENKENPMQMRKNINQFVGRVSKTTYIPAVKKGDTMIENKNKIAETFNDYFSNAGSELSNQIPHYDTEVDDYMDPVSHEFTFKDITFEEVNKTITSLNCSKSFGLDKIPVKILKDSSDLTAPILKSGIFPDDWKKARLSPIYKSSDKEDCSNYRPISVLSVVSKIFEKLVFIQINNYLKKNSIIRRQ